MCDRVVPLAELDYDGLPLICTTEHRGTKVVIATATSVLEALQEHELVEGRAEARDGFWHETGRARDWREATPGPKRVENRETIQWRQILILNNCKKKGTHPG